VDPSVVVRGGVEDAPVGSCLLHVWADGEECCGEVVEGSCGRSACVPDWEGDKLSPSLVFLEGRDEGESLSAFFASLMSRPQSMQKPISMMMAEHRFYSKEVGSGEREYDTS
jgi:hypothetical protein